MMVFFDGEEDIPAQSFIWGESALIGSSYFVLNPTFDIDSLQLHINLESIGYNIFSGMEDHIFIVGAHSSGKSFRIGFC
jgi:hypothetical protein